VSVQVRVLACLTALTLVAAFVTQAHAQQRGPSTPEERTRVVQISKRLRADPIAADVQHDRLWLMTWLIGVPDISVKLCTTFLGDLGDAKNGYPGALIAAMMATEAAFVIENPNKTRDSAAVYLAGVDGAPDGYRAIREKSDYRLPQLDYLIQKREKGKLVDYVRNVAKKCN
jgi:carboxypeptidase Q